jgi:hypothetical protein
VRPYAHCEYDAGFLIFDRWDNSKEVWRRASDFDLEPPPDTNPPDTFQRLSCEYARSHGSASGKGHFKPWALLHMSSATSAYRFVYPTFFTAGSREAYVIDIPSATTIQTIRDLTVNHVCYVEISARHVFICTEDVLRIFSREDGRNVLDIPSARISCAEAFLDTSEVVDIRAVLQPCRIERQDDSNYTSRRNPDEFVAGAYFSRVQPLPLVYDSLG